MLKFATFRIAAAAHIYHYAAYEPTALKRLAMRYATMEADLDRLLRERRFVDLYRVVIQSLRASTESYSLKDLELIYWRDRTGDVRTASDSIVEYERWCITKDNRILDSIANYNREDCVSTAHLRNWLEELRPPGVNFEIVDDSAAEKHEHSAERGQLEARKQAVAVRVRACGHGDPRVRDLVAELLWFHQRSQKPGWWALFERQAWSEDELLDDIESLGGLQLDARTLPVQVKRSLDTAYIFPPQGTKLKVGDRPRIVETLGYAGSIVELSAEDGRIVLRRGAKSRALPEPFSLVSAPIDLGDVPDAVISFADRFARGPTHEDQALLDILMRRVPRLKGRTAGLPVRNPGEPLTDAVIRAVFDLDHSYLFIQGPPGTGKTYTAARAIVALLRTGKRVGVSSNSHKAINNLLCEVEERASESGFRFSGVKKGNRDDPETEFGGINIATIFDSKEATPEHRLIGGTVFHFCREDQRGTYDYLFVDEAGQVSLGNLVANALWVHPQHPETQGKQIKAALAGLEGIAPKDEIEGMMAAQLICAHNAAMECYRRARSTEPGRSEHLAQAGKLSRTFATLLEALNRHRGKGQQRMVVEHVHVHPGGKALVGVVGTPEGGDRAKIEGQAHATQAQIGYAQQPEMRCPQPQDRAAVPAAGDGERPLSYARRTIDGGAEG